MLKLQRQIYNVFSISKLRRCTNVVWVLWRTSNADFSLSHGDISKTLCRNFKKIINGVTRVRYAESILWHQIQANISLSYTKSFQKLLLKGLEK